MTEIRLLSLNIWDLPVNLPFSQRAIREQMLLERLPAEPADLVLLQEAFRPAHRARLIAALAPLVPDALASSRRWVGPLLMDGAGGTLTLSRWPLTETQFFPTPPIPAMRLDERIGRKGWLLTTIETPGGPLLVVNVHLYAGTTEREARVRAWQVHRLVGTLRNHRGPVIVAGDLNMCIEYEQVPNGRNGFVVFREAGFTEVAAGRTDGLITMTQRGNQWARYIPGERPERRLTQVFLRGDLQVVDPPRVCLDDPPVSDHFGLVVGLGRKDA